MDDRGARLLISFGVSGGGRTFREAVFAVSPTFARFVF